MYELVPSIDLSSLLNVDHSAGEAISMRMGLQLFGEDFLGYFGSAIRTAICQASDFTSQFSSAELSEKGLLKK